MGKAKDPKIAVYRRQRNDRIRKRYDEIYKKGSRPEIIYEQLSSETALTISTLEAIVNFWGIYKADLEPFENYKKEQDDK